MTDIVVVHGQDRACADYGRVEIDGIAADRLSAGIAPDDIVAQIDHRGVVQADLPAAGETYANHRVATNGVVLRVPARHP